MDRLEAMKIFIRVAELKSFTKASESLNLPKASVSTYIQNLEILINAKLLNRTTRHVELTPEGASYYKLEFKMSRIIMVNNTDSYLSVCLAGLGIAQIPLIVVKNLLTR